MFLIAQKLKDVFREIDYFKLVTAVPPSIRMPGPAERSVILNQTISLECISAGIPPPSITWIKDGQPVDTTKEHLKVSLFKRL